MTHYPPIAMPSSTRRLRLQQKFLLAGLGLLAMHCREQTASLALVETPLPEKAVEEAPAKVDFPAAETAFGLPIPQGMRVTEYFADAAYLVGRIPLDVAVTHVRDNVLASVAESLPGHTIFPRVYIRGDIDKRICRIEISDVGQGRTRIWISDITSPPSPRGLSEAERWKRAGRNPDGTLLDPNSVF